MTTTPTTAALTKPDHALPSVALLTPSRPAPPLFFASSPPPPLSPTTSPGGAGGAGAGAAPGAAAAVVPPPTTTTLPPSPVAAAVMTTSSDVSGSDRLASLGGGSAGGASPAATAALLPKHTRVRVTGNARTRASLVGLEGRVRRSVGLGGWHLLVSLWSGGRRGERGAVRVGVWEVGGLRALAETRAFRPLPAAKGGTLSACSMRGLAQLEMNC